MNKKLRKAYIDQKAMAKVRGIPWEFTYAMWELKWVLSGKLHLRGNYRYVMSRYNDEGPYSFYNTRIITHEENLSEGHNQRNNYYSVSVIVDGQVFKSQTAAAKALGVNQGTVSKWIKKGKAVAGK